MRINVYLDRQELELLDPSGGVTRTFAVSTAANGAGELYGSERTPRGLHVVRAKIGAGCAPNAVFVRRRPTGERWTPQLAAIHPGRDWMLTRILWLSGREPGFNRGGRVDSLRRKIYIHGTGDEATLSVPRSHGCIRMRNTDVIELFDRIDVNCSVDIVESSGLPYRVRVTRWADDHELLRDIRHAVFVVEQRVSPDLEWDGRDVDCLHAIAEDAGGEAIGCGRLLPDGMIGRVAVMPPWRGRGVGSRIISRLIEVARYAGFERVALNAQVRAVGFYGRHGFVATGAEFIEAGIAHQTMQRSLP